MLQTRQARWNVSHNHGTHGRNNTDLFGAGLNVWGVKGLQKHLEVDKPCVPLVKKTNQVFLLPVEPVGSSAMLSTDVRSAPW